MQDSSFRSSTKQLHKRSVRARTHQLDYCRKNILVHREKIKPLKRRRSNDTKQVDLMWTLYNIYNKPPLIRYFYPKHHPSQRKCALA